MNFDNYLDKQILQLKKKHSDPNYVAPNLQPLIPQDDNEQGLDTWLGAAGIGAGRMLNNTITGGLAQFLGSLGSITEYVSPFSGSQAKDRVRLMSLGIPYETAKEIYPDQDSWLTSGAKGLLGAQNYIDDNLTELRNEVVGYNPSYGTQVAEGTGSSLGFMGAGYGASALASLAGLGPVGVVLAGLIAAGATEALSESGGTLGDAYRQGKYDDGGLAAANKSFAANALLNAGLNYVGGHFSPLTSNIRNPITKFAVNTLGQIGNELLQEPSQQTIEKATQDSLNNGGNFLTALTQRAGDWGNDFVQLAPSVAGSSLLTSLLTGGAAMANPQIRSDVLAEYKNRNVDRESTIAHFMNEINKQQRFQSKLQAETKTPWYNQALVDDINKKIQRADSEIERLQGLLQPQPLQYATQPNETQQNPTIMDLGTNEAFLDDLDYSDFGNDNSNPEQDIPESYAQYISGQNQPYSSPLSFHEFKNAQANQDFDYQSVLRAIAQTSKNNLVPEVEHITPNIAPANTVRILPDITAPNTEHIRPDNSRPAVIRDTIDLQALLPTQNNNQIQQATKTPRIMALGSNEAYYDDDYYSDHFPVNRDEQISPQEQDIPEGHVPDKRQTQNQEQQQGKSENNQQTVPQNKISDNEDFSQFKLDNLTSHNPDVDNSPAGNNAVVRVGNKHYAVRYRVIDVRKLITSHKLNGGKNDQYDQSLQNRQRENMASRIAVDNMAQDIDPSLLTANPFASDGAPIIGSDGQVESGNGRTLALLKAYMSHNPDGSSMADLYRRYLIKHAHEFGLNPQDVDAIERPILVRERWSQADRKAFTREANKSSQATFSKTERALDDVDKLTPEILITFNPDKDIESQQDFIRAYASAILDKSELPDFIQANSYSGDVKISKSGLERIQNTLFAKAYGDTDILQRINEVLSSEDPVKNFSNAIIKAAPKIAIFQSQLEATNNRTNNQDTIRANNSLSLRDDIKRAFEILTEAKLNHTNVEAVVSQGNIVSYTSKEAEAIAKFCERYIRSAKRITTAFNYYADEAAARLDTGQLTFNNQKQKTKMQILQEAFDYAEGKTNLSLFGDTQQGAQLVHNKQTNSYDEEIQRGKSTPDYSESSNPGDLRLYPTPQNREAYNSWDTIGLNGNQQEHISTAQNNADISALQQQYGNEQLTEKTQGNSPNLNDNQGRGNLGSYISNRSQVTNQRGQLQNSSAQGNQDNISTANNLNNQRAQGQITAEQDNSQDYSFAVPQYADISGLIQSEQNNNEDSNTAEALNRTQNDNQQKFSPFDEALRGALQVINDEFDKNPHDKYSVESLWAYMGSLPQDLSNQVAEYIQKQGLTKAYVINDWQTNPETQRLPSYVVPDPKRLKQLLQQLNNSANQQDRNQQQLPKPQDNSAQNFDNINNQQERSKTDDYLPPETIRTKEGDITARGARVQRSFIPSEQGQIKNAARTGKSATRYIFAKHGERDTSAPSNNNPEKYSYDAKLTGYNGYLGDIQIAAGDNSVPLHAFFGTQDGRHYVGITDQNGNFFATYDLQNNQFFINEGNEDNPLVKNYSAQRLEKDFRLAFTYDNDSDMDIDFSKNPTEEILRRLVMMKAINAGEVDTVADADSQIYMAMNKYFASQSGVSLLDMVMADNLIINKVNKQGDNGDRGSTKIIPEMGIDGNPIFEAQTILSLFKKSDVSTVPHEFWHIYEEKIKRLANAGLIKKGSKLFDDWQTIRSEAGMLGVDFSQKLSPQDNAKWRNSQEKNAAMFEQYLRQGKAPQGISAKLRQVFNNFKNWLGNLYRKARDIFYTNANGRRISQPYVSEPMRKVFDHIFTGGKNFNVNQATQQGQKLSSYSDPQGFQEFRQSRLDPQGWFSRWFSKAKNWAGNLFHSVARVGLPKHATDWLSLPFPTQEIQGRFMEAMKTPPRLGMIGRMRRAVRDIAQSVKGGDYSDITLSPRKNDPNLHLNEALQAFRNLGRAKVAAADKAVSVMTNIISPLNQKQRELLNTYTVIRDVIDQIEEMPNSPLSFGLSHQDARKMNAELARMVDRDEQVRDAVKQLDDTRNAQVEEFKKHAHALGLNMDDLFHYHNYFRRRVIQYLDAARSGKRTPSVRDNLDIQGRYDGEINAIMGHSFFKKRKGTLQDYVTDYVQANAEVRAQLAQDIETMKTLEYIRKNHDIAPRLRKLHGITSQQLEIDYDGSQTFSQSGNERQLTLFDVVPEGYEAFDPTATRLIETAQSAPENLMHIVANDIAEQHGFPVDDLLERLGIQKD